MGHYWENASFRELLNHLVIFFVAASLIYCCFLSPNLYCCQLYSETEKLFTTGALYSSKNINFPFPTRLSSLFSSFWREILNFEGCGYRYRLSKLTVFANCPFAFQTLDVQPDGVIPFWFIPSKLLALESSIFHLVRCFGGIWMWMKCWTFKF